MSDSLLQGLTSLLGTDGVSVQKDDLERFSGDALGTYRSFRSSLRSSARPRVVVRPKSALEVSQVVSLANERLVPVVPYGGGTGVMGGAMSVDGCIVVDLKGMDRILEISRGDMAARVEPRVVLKDLEDALNREGLMLGHDPWSLPIATVGGAISTDGVGYRAAKYGSMGEQVLGLEVVLGNGQAVSTKGVPSPSSGPSLKHLFIGSEGILGIVTQATLRVFPIPEKRVLRALGFPDFESGFNAVMEMYAQDVRPTMVDFFEEPPECEISLYLAFEGFRTEAEAQDTRAMAICQRLGGIGQGRRGRPTVLGNSTRHGVPVQE